MTCTTQVPGHSDKLELKLDDSSSYNSCPNSLDKIA